MWAQAKSRQCAVRDLLDTPDKLHLRNRNSCLNVTCLEKAKHLLLPRTCYCLFDLLGYCRSAESVVRHPPPLACTTAVSQPVQLRRRTSAEHLVADSPSNPDSEEQFDPRAKPGAATRCMQTPQRSPTKALAAPPILACTTNSDTDATRKGSSPADPCPLFS